MKRVLIWVLIIIGLVVAVPVAAVVFTMFSAGRMADAQKQQEQEIVRQKAPQTVPPTQADR